VEAGFATKPRSQFWIFEHDSAAELLFGAIVLEARVAKERAGH
jgi:hypothetical protein